MTNPYLHLRAGNYYIRKRIPRRYATVETRSFLNLSLYTDSRQIAERKAAEVWVHLLEAWEMKLEGRDAEGEKRLQAAVNIAARRGYRYLTAPDVATLPLEDLLRRLESPMDKRGRVDMQEADAALGLPPAPVMAVRQALDEFFRISVEDTLRKNPDQIRRWENPRKRAVANFIQAVGDKPIDDLTTEDMFAFKAWLLDRVRTGAVRADSANKDMTHLLGMLRRVYESRGRDLPFATKGVMLKTDKDSDDTRLPFSPEWITKTLLAQDAMSELNDDARLIVLAMVNTGCRPSEIAGLMPDEIRLDAEVPHILMRSNENREIKTRTSKRSIPLVGASLAALQEARTGFPRYAQNSATLSATVNKFLSENGLLETPKHSLYGLRHSLEDRMLKAGIDERVRRDILGHALDRQRYGDGGGLAFVRDQLLKVALG